MDRKKSYIIRKALEEFLEEKEDYLIALSRLARNEKEYSLEEAEKALGLDCSSLSPKQLLLKPRKSTFQAAGDFFSSDTRDFCFNA